MFQAVDKSGYYISCKKNERADIDDDITKESIRSGNGDKHLELKLWIRDLITLEKEEEFYSYCGIQVNIVDIYGVIVAVKSNTYGFLYTVDDGTGEVGCWLDNRSKTVANVFKHLGTSEGSFGVNIDKDKTSMESSMFIDKSEVFSTTCVHENETEAGQWLKEQILQQIEMPSLGLGNSVQLRGKLIDFRGDRCIRIYNIRHVTNIDEETDRRLELIYLHQTLYSQINNLPET